MENIGPLHGDILTLATNQKTFTVAEEQLKENEHSHSSAFTSDPDSKEWSVLALILGCGWRENLSRWQYRRRNIIGKINTNLLRDFSQL